MHYLQKLTLVGLDLVELAPGMPPLVAGLITINGTERKRYASIQRAAESLAPISTNLVPATTWAATNGVGEMPGALWSELFAAIRALEVSANR